MLHGKQLNQIYQACQSCPELLQAYTQNKKRAILSHEFSNNNYEEDAEISNAERDREQAKEHVQI